MNLARFVIGIIVVSALIAGAALYYLQVYAYYEEISLEVEDVQLTSMFTGEPEPILFENFKAIDSARRAGLTALTQAKSGLTLPLAWHCRSWGSKTSNTASTGSSRSTPMAGPSHGTKLTIVAKLSLTAIARPTPAHQHQRDCNNGRSSD